MAIAAERDLITRWFDVSLSMNNVIRVDNLVLVNSGSITLLCDSDSRVALTQYTVVG